MTEKKRSRKRPDKVAAESTEVVRSSIRVSGNIAGDEHEAFEKDVHQFVTDPAFVRASVGVTKNMGDYESLRVDVSVTLPCYVENMDDTYKYAADKAQEYLDAEVELYLGGESKNGGKKKKG